MLSEKERIHRVLMDKGYGTSLNYLDAQQQVSEARHELAVESKRGAEASAARAALEREREAAQSQYAADILSDLRKAQEQVNELQEQLVKAQNRMRLTELRSPIDGVVEQLSVHTLGGVVTPAQHLAVVVPDSEDLTVKAYLENRDVGFVHAGQAVKVKVETFNFTRYGLIDGRVVAVSRDVLHEDDRPSADPPPAPSPAQRPGPPIYVARIALSKTSMLIDGRNAPLRPGMAITAEIRTGERTIINYLFSPVARRTQESLHER
jgi:hemolysin D